MRRRFDWLTQLFARFRGEALYGIASLMASVIGFIGSFVAARALSPDELGAMQTLLLIPTYCSFLPLGVFNGLNRNIAFYDGKGDQRKIQAMVDSSWSIAKIVSAIGALIAVVVWFCFLIRTPSRQFLCGMIFVFFTLVFEPFSQHLEVVYQSSQNFRRLGVRTLWQNAFTFCGNILPLVAGIPGFIGSRCIFAVSRLLVRLPGVPLKASGRGSVKEARELAVTGLPLLVAGVLYSYLGVADRSVIAFFMRTEDLGNYSLTALVVAGIQLVPFCLATLFYPRVAACYGKAGAQSALRRYFWILLGINVAVVLPVCLTLYYAVGPFAERFLPKYSEGIPAAKIGCLSSLAFIYIGVGCIIAVVRRNTPYVIAIAVALAIVWGLGGYLVTHGFGIIGAVWARALATTLLCVFTLVFAYRLTAKDAPV